MAVTTLDLQAQSLQINKSVDNTNPTSLQDVTYTIQYNCISITDPCNNVVIKDVLPASMFQDVQLFTSIGTSSYDASTRTATFNLGNLPAGTTGQVTIKGTLMASVSPGTTIPNSATLTSAGGSPIVSNTVSSTVVGFAKLNLAKYANANPYIANEVMMQGSNGYYSAFIKNEGNVALTNLCITDVLPSPDKLKVTSLSSGKFNSSSPSTIRIQYQTNTNTSWTDLAGSPFATNTSTTVPVSLASNTHITAVRWCFDQPYAPGSQTDEAPQINFQVLSDTPVGSYTNCITATADPLTPSVNFCRSFNVIENITGALPGIKKQMSNGSVLVGDEVTYTLELSNSGISAQALQNGVLVDKLNNNDLVYVTNSWSYTSTYSAVMPTFSSSVTGGYTHLKWALNDNIPVGEHITITFKAKVKNTSAGQKFNTAYATGSNNPPGVCTFGSATADSDDIDGDGNTTELICQEQVYYSIQSLALLKSEKLVKGQLDAAYSKYPAFGQTVPGGLADYRLYVSNAGSVPMKDIVIIDVLPFIGDKGVLDTQDRLTQWRPNLAGPVTPPTGVTVYYSTQSNPCRPELNYSPSGCTTANWSTVPPTDITTVQSLKFDFGSTVIQPGDSLFLAWPMRAPFSAPTNGEIAWNSFGYVATRNDNNTQLLPAEPIKVGIQVNPPIPAAYGDFVWLDTNQDGIQDSGETGVSGVRVELYQDNGDGVPNKTTDTFIGFTVTDASGRYLFSSLNPGNYFAIFYPPSGYAVSPSLVGTDRAIDSEGIITAVTQLDASETDLTWDLGIYPSTTCDVKITNTTVSPCSYIDGSSKATVNVFVTWANPPAGQNITVSLAGAANQTINVTGGATSPALLTFTIAADGANHAINASFGSSTSCADQTSILAPQPCAPAVCALGLTNVQTGACTGSNRQINATVSWSNNPVGENIIVLWDNVPVDTILVSGGLGSPQPTSFYAVGGTGTHTLTARFASTTTCSATVAGISVPVCVQPCGVALTVTPGLCQSATNSYVLSGTVTTTNVPASGTLTISSTAFSPRSLTLPAGNASGTFSYSGLVSNGQTYTVTTSYSNSACAPVSQTYTAPASCSVAPVCSLSANVTAGICASATNTYSATAVVTVSNPTPGVLTVTNGAQSLTFATTAVSSATYTAVFNGLTSDGATHTVTATLPGCSTTTAQYTAPASCSVALVCSLSATVTAGLCASATNTYSATAVVELTNPTPGVLTVTNGAQSLTFATTAVSSATYTAVFNGLTSDGATRTVTATLPGCSTAVTTYTAPASCSVGSPDVAISVTPGVCVSSSNSYSISGTLSLTNATSGTATITDGAVSTTVAVSAGATSVAYSLTGLTSGTGSHTITVSYASKTASTTYAAPASCSVNVAISATPGICQPATNQYSISGTLSLTNAITGTATITDGTSTTTVSVSAGATSVPYTLAGLNSGTGSHTVTVSYASQTASVTYTAPTSCTVAPPCALSLVVTPGVCNSATNQYSLTGNVSAVNASGSQLVTITDGTRSATVTLTGNGPASFTLTGLSSDGVIHSVIASATSCGQTSTTYTAPASCSVGSPDVAISVTPGVCQSATNGYSISGTFSLTNATSGTATITDGTVSTTVAVSAGATSVPYSLTGLTSGTGLHTVTVSFAGETASVTYNAPASCGGCPPATCLPIVIRRIR